MKNIKKTDVLDRNKINFAELDKELKVELSVLGGLDIFTNAHVVGVANNTQKICEVMDLPYDVTKNLMLAAFLHDVGKIRIPNEVLQKNDALNEEEFQIMKMHTVYGYEIVMGYEQFSYLAPIVRGHHENLDGSGYPDGLKDKQITEETKLIKIADIFDALTQRRQYKEGFTINSAVDILIDDIKNGKTGAKYLYYLLIAVKNDLVERLNGNKQELKKARYDLEVLKDLDVIYKKIYDFGPKPQFKRKLNRYELSPGYDMSQNSTLLSNTMARIEKLEKWVTEDTVQIKRLKQQTKEIKKLIKGKEWGAKLFGYKAD